MLHDGGKTCDLCKGQMPPNEVCVCVFVCRSAGVCGHDGGGVGVGGSV